jgi:formylglycine-generating enzyme required for sulfatase activity
VPEPFDPYYRWLGIPPEEQPANHYRLLGIRLYEANADVIESAADRQMGHLRTFQTGPAGALSQKLLNEVAAARLCLLNPQKKAAYDAALREALAPPPAPVAEESFPSLAGPIHVRPSRGVKRAMAIPAWGIAAGTLLLAAVAVTAAVWFLQKTPASPRRETAERPTTSTATSSSTPGVVPPPPPPPPPASKPETQPTPPAAKIEKAQPQPVPPPNAAMAERVQPAPAPPQSAPPAVVSAEPAQPAPPPTSITPEALAAKLEHLVELAGAATDAEQIQSLVELSGAALDEAVAADRLDLAQTLATALGRVSAREAAKPFRVEIRRQRDELERLRRYWPEVQEALQTLQQQPGDAEANELLGQWTCLIKWDWPRGVPYLVRAGNEELKIIAALEQQAATAEPREHVRLGDAWGEYAKRGKSLSRGNAWARAIYWYRRVAAAVTDDARQTAVQQRLNEAVRQLPPSTEPDTLVNALGMKLVRVPAGNYRLGSRPEDIAWATNMVKKNYQNIPPDFLQRIEGEGPVRMAHIAADYYLGAYEVTQQQYKTVMGLSPSKHTAAPAGEDLAALPVESVSWADALEFCRRLSANPREMAARREYRLPSEAEWEVGCRAVAEEKHTRWATHVWYQSNSRESPHAVGTKAANTWGLYDMLGNVAEWCLNRPDDERDCQWPPSADATVDARRAVRGGSWSQPSQGCRESLRDFAPARTRHGDIGFRVVCLVAPTDHRVVAGRKPKEPKRPRAVGTSKPAAAAEKPAAGVAPAGLTGVVIEGMGLGQFRIGATRQALLRALGPPDNPQEERYYEWNMLHVTCVYDRILGVVEIHFNQGTNVMLSSGIRIGSPISEAMARYGRPSRVRPVGTNAQAYEFISRGLILCVDGRGGTVSQIIITARR